MVWTLCSSGAIIAKAGAGASSTAAASNALLAQFQQEAEATINAMTRKDWVTNYSSVATNFQQILNNACSDHAAMKLIIYDMSGYTSRLEAATILDILYDDFQKCVNILKEDNVKDILL